jgi:hypothetical protein
MLFHCYKKKEVLWCLKGRTGACISHFYSTCSVPFLLAVKSPAELASSLRLVNESQLKILLRSEDIRGPWDSYKSDTALLPLQSTPSKRATIRHAVNSVDNVVDLRSQSIDKSTWTIDHHCARLLLLWSEALTGPGGKLQGFKN